MILDKYLTISLSFNLFFKELKNSCHYLELNSEANCLIYLDSDSNINTRIELL